ncbi:tRNA (guanine(10)-N2)-dimethyltransferase [uncultured archaeon]|nr:tRNA (guanine(10)-N2)-dimethyltransferase [uncultured archaeon]
MELFSTSFCEIAFLDQCLIIEAQGLDVGKLATRLAMTHRIIEVLAICDATDESLAEAVAGLDLPRRKYKVRARRIRDSRPAADAVEREVGRILFYRGYHADLKRPEMVLRAIISSGKIILGLELAKTDRSSFEARRPHLKPFFHPGVLMPRMARALVNLSQARAGERLLDPFAGTCGILLEACLIGIKGIGVEVQTRLVKGALCNLQAVDYSLLCGDAKRLPFRDETIDAAVLDTPYGRSAKILANSKELLLKEALAELHRTVKPSRRIVIVADAPLDIFLSEYGFNILQKHTDRVHRSLTRHIFVCQNSKLHPSPSESKI